MATANLISTTSMVEAVLYSNQLTATTVTTIYTVGSGKGAKIATATICNTDASAQTIDVHVVASGGSAGATNKVISAYSIAAGDTLSLNDILGGMMLGEGDFIAVKAGTANKLNVTLTGAVAG